MADFRCADCGRYIGGCNFAVRHTPDAEGQAKRTEIVCKRHEVTDG